MCNSFEPTSKITVNHTVIILHLFKLSGEDKFRVLTRSFYRSFHGCLVVFDVSDRSSFEEVCW